MNDQAPATRIRSDVPITHPSHPSHHRRPATDKEALAWAALRWTPDATLEAALALRARHPDLAGELLLEITGALPRYLEVRQAASDAGRAIAKLGPEALAEIDAAAERARQPEPDPEAVNRAGRRAFREQVGRYDFTGAGQAWEAWTREYIAAIRAFSRRAIARAVLQLRGGGYGVNVMPPDFMKELADALAEIRRSIEGEGRER